jgi:hypothetical protein
MECVHLKEQSERRQHIQCTSHAFSQWDPRTSCFKTLSGTSPNRQVQAYLKWPQCRCVNVLERNGNPPLQISLLEVYLPGLGVQGLWLAIFLRAAREVDLARLLKVQGRRDPSPTEATVTIGCPRCIFLHLAYIVVWMAWRHRPIPSAIKICVQHWFPNQRKSHGSMAYNLPCNII